METTTIWSLTLIIRASRSQQAAVQACTSRCPAATRTPATRPLRRTVLDCSPSAGVSIANPPMKNNLPFERQASGRTCPPPHHLLYLLLWTCCGCRSRRDLNSPVITPSKRKGGVGTGSGAAEDHSAVVIDASEIQTAVVKDGRTNHLSEKELQTIETEAETWLEVRPASTTSLSIPLHMFSTFATAMETKGDSRRICGSESPTTAEGQVHVGHGCATQPGGVASTVSCRGWAACSAHAA